MGGSLRVRPAHTLTAAEERRALSLSMFDGALFALMVGVGETYFVAAAVRLGASPLELGLITALPLLFGSFGSLAALGVLGVLPRRRELVVVAALLQSVSLLAMASLAGGSALGIPGLLALMCAYHFCGQAAGVAWSSWYGDLVPAAVRGRYFARRTRLVQLATFLGLIAGGTALELLEPGATSAAANGGGLPGFAAVFAAAAVVRVASAAVLARSPEPRFSGLPAATASFRYLYTARGRNAWRLVYGNGAMLAACYLAAPFYAPYMLEELGIGYAGYTLALGSQVAIKVLTMPFWGRAVDRRGARSALRAAVLMSALIPLPWFWIGGVPGVVLAHLFSGFAWGGYEVALFASLLDSTVRRTRPLVFTAHNVVNGVSQIAGSAAGAGVLGAAGFFAVFGASLAGRLVVALALPMLVRDLRWPGAARRRPLALRVVGQRQGTGLAHRPVLDPSEGEAWPGSSADRSL